MIAEADAGSEGPGRDEGRQKEAGTRGLPVVPVGSRLGGRRRISA